MSTSQIRYWGDHSRPGRGRSKRLLPLMVVAALASLLLSAAAVPATAAEASVEPATTTALTTETGEGCESVPGDDWCEDWTVIYDGDLSAPREEVHDVVLSPAGDQLFVSGYNVTVDEDGRQEKTIVTGAFDATTGEKAWVAEYLAGTQGFQPGIAVSPDGSTVYVAGTQGESIAAREFVTIAYNAVPPEQPGDPELGEQLWSATFGPASNSADGIVVTPDGSTVLVVGNGREEACVLPNIYCADIVTIAYDAATGEQLWLSRYGAPNAYDDGHGIALSPDGEFAYVTGYVIKGVGVGKSNTVTIAYEVEGDSAGEVRWVAEYQLGLFSQGAYVSHNDGIAVSEDGTRVLVSARTQFDDGTPQIVTIAYDATTGGELWSAWYGLNKGITGSSDPVGGLALSPNDDLVFVTGYAGSNPLEGRGRAIVTIAYEQTTGLERWSRTYTPENTGKSPKGNSVASSPDGTLVYVTGSDNKEHVTLAYDARTGEQVAVARLTNVFTDFDTSGGRKVLPSADGSRVYTVGDVSPGNRPSSTAWVIASYPAPGRIS